MRLITTIIAASTVLFFAGCSKHECEDSSPAQVSQGGTKLPDVFVYVLDGGVAVPNYPLNVHCGPTVTSNGSGRIMFSSGGCTTISEINLGSNCFQRNTYYWLKPPGNSTSRKYLRFKFDNSFDFSTLSSALVRFEPSTYTWAVPNPVAGFDFAIYDSRKTLPACQGLVRQ